ncbi:fungal-specific transcription factor domain-containing protein [Auriculariales sp. MPI-PUGE-AT-0066]|nr:fungal-specific transcription factor domain-containing protein [Auriculariales sp. MPI-PUGE-AT-0066]
MLNSKIPAATSPAVNCSFQSVQNTGAFLTTSFETSDSQTAAFHLQLPPPDQLAIFVRRYFETLNVVYPLFHRGLFEQRLLHMDVTRDAQFTAVVLLVCALGAAQLAADDLLNLSVAESPSSSRQWERLKSKPAGLECFAQVEPFLRMPTPADPQLLDVQIFHLASLYTGIVLGSPTFWLHLNTAIQLAIQRNDHRSCQTTVPRLEEELKKRTFWSLVTNDRRIAAIYGRPICVKDDAFDLELPLEVGDAPKSLDWHPNIADLEVYLQSSFLHAMYQTLVIMAHNPFMRTTARDFSQASRAGTTGVDLIAALEICTAAALECSFILGHLVDRLPWAFGLPGLADPPFVSGLMLLVNLYGFRSSLTEAKKLQFGHAVDVCLSALKLVSTRFRLVGKHCDILHQLVSGLRDEPAMPTPPPTAPFVDFKPSILHPKPADGLRDDTYQLAFNINLLPTGLRTQMSSGLRKEPPSNPLPQS